MAKGKVKNSDAKTSYKNGNGGLAELLKELWNAAVALRGSIEPSDYKRYVLPLIFLRFLSLRFEKRHAELIAEIADPKSDLHTKDKQLALDILNDADNYTSKQTFLVPDEARWPHDRHRNECLAPRHPRPRLQRRIMKTKIWLLTLFVGASFIFEGCAAPQYPVQRGSDSTPPALGSCFPPPPTNLVFHPFRSDVYSARDLLTNYDTNRPESYYSTPDWIIYRCYTNFADQKKHGHFDEITASYMRLHDLSIEEALDKYIRASKGVVGIMGGHDMERKVSIMATNRDGQVTNAGYAPYMKIALLARALATNGFTILTAGGPGAMEAGNLGAWMAGGSEGQLSNAVRMLESVPKSTNSALWLRPAFMVMNQYTNANLHSNNIGVPTWFYGFEPPNPFATHIAKYFENSLREEHLLAISQSGIIFAPGSAGTVQEIFQSACQNYYGNYTSNKFPMLLFGTDYWNRRAYGAVETNDKPVWPLLEQLGNEKNFRQQLMISDDIDVIASFICTNRINQTRP